MAFIHDFEKFPELSNTQILELGFLSPHIQILDDFEALVVRVKDGDTVQLRVVFRDFDFPLRLGNINTKELGEGGKDAKEWLTQRIEGQQVQIRIDKDNRVDKYGRLLGEIHHKGINMGEALKVVGLATDFEKRNEGLLPNLNKMFAVSQWF